MKLTKTEIEFLRQSNLIEEEKSAVALEDAKKAYAYAKSFEKEWNINFILKVHKLLMKRLRPDIAGKLRNCDAWIGGTRKIFVNEVLLKEELKNWVKESQSISTGNFNLKEFAKRCHVDFEKIHPFEDGNGRTGRILWQIQRIKVGSPVSIIWDRKKYDYYKWFQEDDFQKRIKRLANIL